MVISSGRAQLHADSAGSGAPVVLLHAGVADRRMWRDQVDALAAASFHATAYDRRGFGDSLHAEESYSQVGDLLAVLDHVAPGQAAILVGCSQGGKIAIDFALAHAARVRALVLVAPAISGAPQPAAYAPAIEAWIEQVERAEAAGDLDRLNALEAQAWLDGPLAPEGRVSGPVRELFLAMNGIALRAAQRGTAIDAPPAWPRLRDVNAPALVLWGDLDFPDLIRRCEHLSTQLPQARSLVLRDAAHLPNLEHPARFNRALLEFVATLERPAGRR